LPKIDASEGLSCHCIKGVLARETASKAPAVAESMATPLKQSKSQISLTLPGLADFWGLDGAFLDETGRLFGLFTGFLNTPIETIDRKSSL